MFLPSCSIFLFIFVSDCRVTRIRDLCQHQHTSTSTATTTTTTTTTPPYSSSCSCLVDESPSSVRSSVLRRTKVKKRKEKRNKSMKVVVVI